MPIRTIVNNAGVDGSVIVGKLKENKSASEGYDAQSDKYVDMFKAGIIDPCLLYTSPSPRDLSTSRMPSSA